MYICIYIKYVFVYIYYIYIYTYFVLITYQGTNYSLETTDFFDLFFNNSILNKS